MSACVSHGLWDAATGEANYEKKQLSLKSLNDVQNFPVNPSPFFLPIYSSQLSIKVKIIIKKWKHLKKNELIIINIASFIENLNNTNAFHKLNPELQM